MTTKKSLDPVLQQELAAARERVRKKLQGHGRPIIADRVQSRWVVQVGGKRYSSDRWKTFHDFLAFYIYDVLKGPWVGEEHKKPRAERHAFLNWVDDFATEEKNEARTAQGIHVSPMSSSAAAFLGLAYNLYLISHNNGKVHELLVRRLQNADQFLGAWYEAFVTGAMIRSGFDIELEDETDPTVKHCEFTATFRSTGQKYSVEAKVRRGATLPPKVGHQLHKALQKRAPHPRIFFIEINAPHDGTVEGARRLVQVVADEVLNRQDSFTILMQPAPPAYLFFTNQPPGLPDTPYLFSGMMASFRMPDFHSKMGPLEEALAWRERHRGVLELSESLEEHIRVPATFDGSLPEITYSNGDRPRLTVGNHLVISTPEGDVEGELASGAVNPSQKIATCAVRLVDGTTRLVQTPLTDAEMGAYNESPETFFGVITGPAGPMDHPFKWYDWFYETYRGNTKEHFLEKLMHNHHDIERLKTLSQDELARIFARRTAESVLHQTGGLGANTDDTRSKDSGTPPL